MFCAAPRYVEPTWPILRTSSAGIDGRFFRASNELDTARHHSIPLRFEHAGCPWPALRGYLLSTMYVLMNMCFTRTCHLQSSVAIPIPELTRRLNCRGLGFNLGPARTNSFNGWLGVIGAVDRCTFIAPGCEIGGCTPKPQGMRNTSVGKVYVHVHECIRRTAAITQSHPAAVATVLSGQRYRFR